MGSNVALCLLVVLFQSGCKDCLEVCGREQGRGGSRRNFGHCVNWRSLAGCIERTRRSQLAKTLPLIRLRQLSTDASCSDIAAQIFPGNRPRRSLASTRIATSMHRIPVRGIAHPGAFQWRIELGRTRVQRPPSRMRCPTSTMSRSDHAGVDSLRITQVFRNYKAPSFFFLQVSKDRTAEHQPSITLQNVTLQVNEDKTQEMMWH